MTNLYALFKPMMTTDRPLLLADDGRTLATYPDLDKRSGQYSHILRQFGLKPGDRVAAQIEKSPEALYLYCACLRSGFIYLPLNTAYGPEELDHFLSDAKPSVFIVDPAKANIHRHRDVKVVTLDPDGFGSLTSLAAASAADTDVVPRTDDDVAVIIYTSGTTGLPKGAMISHGNLCENAKMLLKAWDWSANDVMLHTLPVFHVHGLFVGLHLPLAACSPILLHKHFDASAVIAALPKATVFMGVPTYYTRLLQDGIDHQDCARMRLFISGSAPLLSATFTQWEQATDTTILERYGMSETGMNTSNPLLGERRPGTVGQPLPGVECLIVDEQGKALPPNTPGDLLVKGANVFQGYWENPEKTRESFTDNGYFMTGDIASMDSDGYISIVGRSKDLIISGGLNIYPKELELLLDKMEMVIESAVIGLDHPDFGEAVCAVLAVAPDCTLDTKTVTDYMRAHAANFKVPKKVCFVEQLPKNSMGKVQKNVLREQFAGAFKSP